MPSDPPDPAALQQALSAHRTRLAERHLLDLFAADPRRLETFCLTVAGLRVDFSKQAMDAATLETLLDFADARQWRKNRDALFAGELVNYFEGRPALHMAVRGFGPEEEVTDAARAHRRVLTLARTIRDPASRINTLIVCGVGGSHLGPAMVCQALARPEQTGPDVRFVSDLDAADLSEALTGCDPARTALLVMSKTFTTLETLANAEATVNWLRADPGFDADRQVYAVTAAVEKACDFGVPVDNIATMFDWVGGRFSVTSTVGLPIAISLGPEVFDDLVAGAANMDRHFITTDEGAANLPLFLALVDYWNLVYIERPARAVLPYVHGLRLWPDYLSQLEMESLGKGIDIPWAPVVFGTTGTSAQHAFMQAVHQGPQVIPIDFLGVLDPPPHATGPDHTLLMAQMIAQSEALMVGRKEAVSHLKCPGNRPSTTFLLDRLDARTLGALIAAFEHKVYCLGVLLGLNPFDQWGVELGKTIAKAIYGELTDKRPDPARDPSTRALMDLVAQRQKG